MPASRSLIALLVGTVAFFALWMVALKPSGSSSTGGSSPQALQSAVTKAHQAVQTSNASNAASGNDGTHSSPATSPSGGASASSATAPSSSHPSSATARAASGSHAARKPAVHLTPKVATHNHAALARLSTVQHALTAHKVVVMLFYNPTASDDQLVKHELSAVPSFRGRVVKLTIPLSESANFTPVTQQVPVNFSPTVVLISPDGQAQELTGLTDRFVIAQHVRDAASATK